MGILSDMSAFWETGAMPSMGNFLKCHAHNFLTAAHMPVQTLKIKFAL